MRRGRYDPGEAVVSGDVDMVVVGGGCGGGDRGDGGEAGGVFVGWRVDGAWGDEEMGRGEGEREMKQEEYWWKIYNFKGELEAKVRVMLVGKKVVPLEDVYVGGCRMFSEGRPLSSEYKVLEKIVSEAKQVDSVIE